MYGMYPKTTEQLDLLICVSNILLDKNPIILHKLILLFSS